MDSKDNSELIICGFNSEFRTQNSELDVSE
jgi:hypothetical protein